MASVRKIDWTVKTGEEWWSGTDDPILIDIMRDDDRIKRLNLEPGRSHRLDRGESVTYFWVFDDPDLVGVSYSGTQVPYTEEFPKGIEGHLDVTFIAQGADAWEALDIRSTVYTGRMRHVPGSVDEFEWVEIPQDFNFRGREVLSTDHDEGVTRLNLNY